MASLEGRYQRDTMTWLCFAGVVGVFGFKVALGAPMPVLREHLGIGLMFASLHFTMLAPAGTLSAAMSG